MLKQTRQQLDTSLQLYKVPELQLHSEKKNTKVSMIKCKRLQVYTEYVAYDTGDTK